MYEFVYPLLAAATFAISSVIMKHLSPYGSALRLNFFRTSVGAILFLIHATVAGILGDLLKLSIWTVIFLVFSVVFNVVLGDSSYFASQEIVGVKIATPIVNLYPLLTIILAFIFLEEEVTLKFLGGTVTIILGVILLSQKEEGEHNERRLKGFIYAFSSLVLYAAGVLAVTYASTDVDVVVANSIRLPAAAILLFTISHTPPKRDVKKLDKRFTLTMLFAGLLGTYLSSYYLVLSAQTLGAGKTAVLTSLGPLFALPLAIFWLKENVTWKIVLGTVISIAGLVLVLI